MNRDEARLKSWEGGEYIAVNNVRNTHFDNAHWGWIRGFNEGFDAGAASVSRKEIDQSVITRLRSIRGEFMETVETGHPVFAERRRLDIAAIDAILAEMENEK